VYLLGGVPNVRMCTVWVTLQTHFFIRTYLCLDDKKLLVLLHTAESFLRHQPVLSQSRNSPHFMEAEGSLRHSYVPATYQRISPGECFVTCYLLQCGVVSTSPSWRTAPCRLSATAYLIHHSPLNFSSGCHFSVSNLRTRHAVVTATHLS